VLKPNDLGLFDMLGNAMEWTQTNAQPFRSYVPGFPREDRDFGGTILGEDRRYQKGGSYFYQTTLVRSGAHNMNPPASTHDQTGFRIARTIREGED
jgi:formylglycine-generating enzyme required for sulfatase activity